MKKFKRCILEYVDASDAFSVDEDDATGGEAMPGADPGAGAAPMGGGPDAGGAPMGGPDAGGAPMGGPDAGGAPMGGPDAGGAPAGDGNGSSPEGFGPQNVDPNASLDGMGGSPEGSQPGAEPMQQDDEVIDVDELTDTQEETEKKVDALSHKFEKLLGSLDSIEKRINNIDAHTNEYLGSLKSEIEKRNPTPMQRLTMRSTKSAPFGMTPNEYMNNYAPENYSSESDNNGADDPQYKITKDDIDSFTDYSSIAREFDGKMGLKDIFGY